MPLGEGPKGFSFEASLMMPAGSRPSSRATVSIGLPGSYTGCVRMPGLASSAKVMARNDARCGAGSKQNWSDDAAGHAHVLHARRDGGLEARTGVLEHEAAPGRHAHLLRREQEHFRRGLAVRDILGRHDDGK